MLVPPIDRSVPPPLVVAVDDEAGNRELVTRHLQQYHYDVRTFADGESALEFIDTSVRLPDLIDHRRFVVPCAMR